MRGAGCGVRDQPGRWEGEKDLKSEVGKIEGGKLGRWEGFEVGSRTRRRPIGRDYAAAKDAEVGMKENLPRNDTEKHGSFDLTAILPIRIQP